MNLRGFLLKYNHGSWHHTTPGISVHLEVDILKLASGSWGNSETVIYRKVIVAEL